MFLWAAGFVFRLIRCVLIELQYFLLVKPFNHDAVCYINVVGSVRRSGMGFSVSFCALFIYFIFLLSLFLSLPLSFTLSVLFPYFFYTFRSVSLPSFSLCFFSFVSVSARLNWQLNTERWKAVSSSRKMCDSVRLWFWTLCINWSFCDIQTFGELNFRIRRGQ